MPCLLGISASGHIFISQCQAAKKKIKTSHSRNNFTLDLRWYVPQLGQSHEVLGTIEEAYLRNC